MSYTAALVTIYILIFAYGLCIGSFSNVCILRIPEKESIIPHSHCMTCGYHLRWFDMIPLFSWLFLRGRCRKCGAKISAQYPLVEGLNGLFYVLLFLWNGLNIESAVFCLFFTSVVIVSVIDFRYQEVPDSMNIAIGVLGILECLYLWFARRPDLKLHIIGFFSVSVLLLIIFLVSAGRAMGGGDVKLMAVCGLVLGVKEIVFGFVLGCLLASIIHPVLMRLKKAERRLPFVPYLAAGMVISIFAGTAFVDWYLKICGLG
jgi:leader peptidase (prepilin peptidase)/N-methyltransferase